MMGSNRSISTYRQVNATSPDKTTSFSATAIHEDVDVYIESMKTELQFMLGIKPGYEGYTLYVDAEELTDIRVSDKIVDNKGYVYFVQGIKRFEENDDTCNLLEILLNKEMVRYTD